MFRGKLPRLSSYSHTWVVLPYPSRTSSLMKRIMQSTRVHASQLGKKSSPGLNFAFLQHGLGFPFHIPRDSLPPTPFFSFSPHLPPLCPLFAIRTTATDLLLGIRTEETNPGLV